MTTLMLLARDLSMLYGPMDHFQSLVWCEKYTGCGNFTLILPMTDAVFDALGRAEYVAVSDRPGLGRIEKIRYTQNAGGGEVYGASPSVSRQKRGILTVSGRMAESILSDRVIARGTHAAGSLVSCVQRVVEANAGAQAGERALPYFHVASSAELTDEDGTAYAIDDFPGGQSLDVWVRKTLAEAGAAYRILPDYDTGTLVFSVYRGLNRTQGQNVNNFAVFSTSFSSIGALDYISDKSEYKNFAYIAGEGEGNDRVVVTLDLRQNPDDERRELFIDARDLSSNNGDTTLGAGAYRNLLLKRGRQRLLDHEHVFSLDGTAADYSAVTPDCGQTDSSENGSPYPLNQLPPIGTVFPASMQADVDYMLGDLCDITSEALHMTWSERITEITYTYEGTRRLVDARFGCAYPDLKEYVRRTADDAAQR